jgi:hypothetical protein
MEFKDVNNQRRTGWDLLPHRRCPIGQTSPFLKFDADSTLLLTTRS